MSRLSIRPEHRQEDLALFVSDEENRRYYSAIAARIMGGTQESEDLLQKAFIRASIALGDMSDERVQSLSLRPWFANILKNLTIDHARRKAAQERNLIVQSLDEEVSMGRLQSRSRLDEPEGALLHAESSHALRHRVLDRISAEDRAILIFKYAWDWSVQDLADLGFKPEAIRTRLSRAHAAVRRLIRELVADGEIQESEARSWFSSGELPMEAERPEKVPF